MSRALPCTVQPARLLAALVPLILATAIASLLAACVGSDDDRPSEAPPVVAIGSGTLIQAATGGRATSADGQLTLIVPAGALTQDATVSITTNTSWQLPGDLGDTFSRVSTTAYDIKAEGGTWVAGTPPQIKFDSALAATSGSRAQALALSRQLRGTTTNASRDTWGITFDCPNGETTVVVLPPPANGGNPYDPATPLIGCDPPPAHITVAPVQWKQPPITTAWNRFVSMSSVQGVPSLGDSWIGSQSMTVALTGTQLTVVDGAGNLVPASNLPLDPALPQGEREGLRYTNIVMDGPASFYLSGEQWRREPPSPLPGGGVSGAADQTTFVAQVIQRYHLQYSRLLHTWLAQRDWTYAVPGSVACQRGLPVGEGGVPCGDHVFTGSVGLARDPGTYDAVFAGVRVAVGPTGLPLGGYVGRLDRTGHLMWQTAVPNANTTFLTTSGLHRLEVDQRQGNIYFASNLSTSLWTSQLDRTGKINWSQKSLDVSGLGTFSHDFSSGVSATGELYLATRFPDALSAPHELRAVRVNADNGLGTVVGSFVGLSETSFGELGPLAISSIGTVFASFHAPFGASIPGGPGAYVISTGPSPYLASVSAFNGPGALQIDGSDQLLLQQVGAFDSVNHPGTCTTAQDVCTGINLRKFKF